MPKSKKRYYRKLVRDKIAQLIAKKGGRYKTKKLKKKEFETELRKKLLEESRELARAPRQAITEELADILEVAQAMAAHYKIPWQRVIALQRKKRTQRGGFKEKVFLIWSADK
jgi:predicted house-cleaning noncanonical NTP pyrophosphatase (MazG superfamily)